MAHPTGAEASNVPANSGSAVEDFADFLDQNELTGEDEDEEQDFTDEGDDEMPEGDDPEGEQPEDSDEPEAPAIDPPVSWAADAKELFAQLPPELQTQIVERETQRERAIQKATTEAAEARRNAAMEAQTAFAEDQRRYANELEQYASLLAPQRPDPAILRQDPALFYQLQAEYEAATAQQQQMLQRSAQARQEAVLREQQAEQAFMQAEASKLVEAIPEWADPAKRQALLTDLERVGADLGYAPDVMAQATASDILALRKASEWKAKAAKYDALQKTKMSTVRAAKSLPKVAKPGVAPTRGEISASRSQAAWSNVKKAQQSRNKDAVGAAFADFLETSGHL